MRASLGFLVASIFALGCQPQLQDEYTCVRGECPPDWHCWADGVCREDGPAARLNDDCTTDEECDTRVCASSIDPRDVMSPEPDGFCSINCESDDDCTGIGDGPDGVCFQEVCYPRCLRRMDCPAGTQCYYPMIVPVPPPNNAFCFSLRNQTLDGQTSCTSPMNCENPAWCVRAAGDAEAGVCTMLCQLGDSDQCPGDAACQQIYRDLGACLRSCTSDGTECGSGDLSCVTLTIGGESGQYCAPAAWDGTTLPLGENFRDTLMATM